MNTFFDFIQKNSPKFLRISMGIVLLWIGALKFVDPTPVVGLLQASFPFLASNVFVYIIGVVEVGVALMLFVGFVVRYLGILLMFLFASTLVIFLTTPNVTYAETG
ncbi:DoxX family membrane protein, partial [candidate division KSB1 bacterium]|nr:DoxX family membrane protein [candidate division KSB1 bacterium]